MTDKEMAENFVDAFLKKDDFELDKFLDENLGNLKLTTKQAGVILGVIKGVGIGSYLAGLKAGKDKTIKDLKDDNKFMSDNYSKAKELLKWALHSDPEHDEDFDQKWEEAEEFLKEE